VAHGSVTFSNTDLIGSTGTVVCASGYTISGSAVATCTQSGSTGSWSAMPSCNAIHCGSLVVSHGTVTFLNTDLIGSTATVVCSSGYILSSTTLAVCTQSGTSGSWTNVPTCNALQCSALSISNSLSITFSSSNNVGSQATVVCNAGCALSSSTVATCSANGNTAVWINVPTCDVLHCGAFSVAHATWTLSNSDLVGSTANVVCSPGYSSGSQSSVSTCTQSGSTASWANVPTCQAATCSALPSPVGYASIIYSTYNTGPYPIGTTAAVQCASGYVFSGSGAYVPATCSASPSGAAWTNIPACVPAYP